MPNEITIQTAPLPAETAGAFVIYADESAAPAGGGADIWKATGLDWARVSEAAGFRGKQGQVLDLVAPAGLGAKRLIVLGAGKPDPNASLRAEAPWLQ